MIVLMGVAGSGKSMQGRLLADENSYAWVSSGEILRVLITGTRRQEMLKGKLLSDSEMINVMGKVFDLIDPNDEFVLDGFPRTIKQTNWLFKENEKGIFSRVIVLHLFASDKVVRERLSSRGRIDDNEEAITERINEYKSVTLPIINKFKEHNVTVYDIDASRDPQAIHDEIMRLVAK